MGIRGKFILTVGVIFTLVSILTFILIEKSHKELIEKDAVRIADIVSTQVLADRAIYTRELVGKLTKDGTGAHLESAAKSGFIMLPAQFVRMVSQTVAKTSGKLYAYFLKSKWNLNVEQGLADDFDKWAWGQLEEQESSFKKQGTDPKESGYPWKPIYRFETHDGKANLVYLRADPASAQACVTCHNNLEPTEKVRTMRGLTSATMASKQWALHDLMGAIRVQIPVDEVAMTAAQGRNDLLSTLALVLLGGVIGLFALIYMSIIKPVEASVIAVSSFSKSVDSVVDQNRKLLEASERQVAAFKASKDQSDETKNLKGLAMDNAIAAEESAAQCRQLDGSFSELKERMLKILGKKPG
jgi:hypothetical protein